MRFLKSDIIGLFLASYLGAAFPEGLSAQTQREQYHRDSLFLEATSAYITDRPQQALDMYRALLEKDPDNATAAYQVSNILAESNKFSDALIYAEKACLAQPENEWFQLLRAQLYKTTRQFKKAGEVFALLKQQFPAKLEYAYEEANMAVMQGDLAAAIAVYDDLQAHYGFNDEWSMQKYKMYMGVNNTKAARAEIAKISEAMPAQTKYLEMLAQACMKEKDYKQAYRYFKKILEIKPDDPYIHISLADYYRNTGNFNEAYRSLEKAVANPQLDFKTKLNVLQAYYTGKDDLKPKGDVLTQARNLFEHLNKVHPDQAEGFFMHAKFLILLEDIQPAVPLLQKAVALDSNVFGSWELLLYAAHQSVDTALMESAGRQACERFPEQASPYMYRAVAALLQDNYALAVDLAEKGRKRNMGANPFVEKVLLQILGDGYFALGQYDRSLQAYEQLFNSDPDDRYVRNNYAYYLAVIGRDLAKAEAMAGKLCREEPQNATFLDTYAWVLFRSGNYAKALEYVEKALKHGADKDATVWDHLGDIRHRIGDTAKAVEAWKTAQKLASGKTKEDIERKIENPALADE
ncbi:MAG: tetratricopeptide repeat protein [Bacteroides sp.]|nr:tetratricopeptide repeat protein [Bacteroides sp.]MCM1084715.1 tetratricopeptide repeat protein [Bacteroides sp.]